MSALEQLPKSSTTKYPEMSLADRVYLAKYIEVDGPTKMGDLFRKSPKKIGEIVTEMKSDGEFELYRNLTDEEYEKILKCEEGKVSK